MRLADQWHSPLFTSVKHMTRKGILLVTLTSSNIVSFTKIFLREFALRLEQSRLPIEVLAFSCITPEAMRIKRMSLSIAAD